MAERSQTAPEAGNDTGNEDAIGGNVNKYIVLPNGYSGQPKKGHLTFDACFESGNLGRVEQVSDFEYDLFIRPDTCNPRFRVWFNFTVENVKELQLPLLSNKDQSWSNSLKIKRQDTGKPSTEALGMSGKRDALTLSSLGRTAQGKRVGQRKGESDCGILFRLCH
uniref:ATP/GTP binding protein-like 4 n=1 Tax=Mus musculus TaxID=10090 RepID=A2A9S6_MOUSE